LSLRRRWPLCEREAANGNLLEDPDRMRKMASLVLWLTLGVLISACSGSPKPLKVSGQLKNNDKPYTAPKGAMVTIVFTPVVEAGAPFDSYPAKFNRGDSSFTVAGKSEQGIPPGKYRISVQQFVSDPTAQINEMNARFKSEKSAVIRDVTDETPIIIDLAKPTGK
jgi:hypothetical protein